MKISKQELKQRISDSIEDQDLVISILEDIEDSMEEGTENVINETLQKENEGLKFKNAELKRKYKERFLSGKSDDETILPDSDPEEPSIEDVIDIKEI